MSIKKDKKLLEEVRNGMKLKHYSIHTERAYCDWIKRFAVYHKMSFRQGLENGEQKIELFLTDLAVNKNIVWDWTQSYGNSQAPGAGYLSGVRRGLSTLSTCSQISQCRKGV